LRAGAQEYLPKRLMSPEMLLRAIESARDRFKLHAERRIVTDELARLNGELERRVNGTQRSVGRGERPSS